MITQLDQIFQEEPISNTNNALAIRRWKEIGPLNVTKLQEKDMIKIDDYYQIAHYDYGEVSYIGQVNQKE